jgi:uncharacterized RDD family membrane protein YckC
MSSSPTGPADYDDSAAGEKLIIETPEQTSIEFPLAGIGSRFLAILIDSLIQAAFVFVSMLVLVLLGLGLSDVGMDRFVNANVWLVAILIFVYFLVMYGYFILFESIWNGQTPGKRLTHIRVIKDSGQPITAIDSFGRNLMRLVDQLPFAYGIGVLCAWISPQSKRLGDYVAGTVVVHEKPFETVAPQWNEPSSASAATHQYGANRLTPEEFALVETFLSRRSALDGGVRYDTAAGIVRRIESKLTMPPEGKPTAEKLLEELSFERRSSAGYR